MSTAIPVAALKERRILVCEDEFLLAEELAQALEDAGASILGPAPTLAEAQALLDGAPPLDAAVLDVNLAGISVFPLADMLMQRGVPVVFTTGYDASAFPSRFSQVPKFGKPVDMDSVTEALVRALGVA